MTGIGCRDKIHSRYCNNGRRLLLKRGGDNMTIIALIELMVAILGLLVNVISLCYIIIGNEKK